MRLRCNKHKQPAPNPQFSPPHRPARGTRRNKVAARPPCGAVSYTIHPRRIAPTNRMWFIPQFASIAHRLAHNDGPQCRPPSRSPRSRDRCRTPTVPPAVRKYSPPPHHHDGPQCRPPSRSPRHRDRCRTPRRRGSSTEKPARTSNATWVPRHAVPNGSPVKRCPWSLGVPRRGSPGKPVPASATWVPRHAVPVVPWPQEGPPAPAGALGPPPAWSPLVPVEPT